MTLGKSKADHWFIIWSKTSGLGLNKALKARRKRYIPSEDKSRVSKNPSFRSEISPARMSLRNLHPKIIKDYQILFRKSWYGTHKQFWVESFEPQYQCSLTAAKILILHIVMYEIIPEEFAFLPAYQFEFWLTRKNHKAKVDGTAWRSCEEGVFSFNFFRLAEGVRGASPAGGMTATGTCTVAANIAPVFPVRQASQCSGR